MKETVLRERALAKHAGRFVWLAVDIDKDANARFVSRYPVPGIPTLLVIDPATENVILTRSAGVDLPQLVALFDEGERALKGAPHGEADVAFAAAETLAGDGKAKQAAEAFERALKTAPPGWTRHREAVEGLVLAREGSGDARGCAELATAESNDGPRDAWWANLVTAGLGCAQSPTLIERAKAGLKLELGADDRSGLYEVLVDATHDRALAAEWLTFLDGEAARATTPAARAVYDPHRLLAAVALGDPSRALAALQASERDLPNDYNGPARLAIAYLEMGRYDDALAASERALAKVYGPRRLRVQETRATIYRRKGDLAGAQRVLDEAIRDSGTLPPTPRLDSAIARLRQLKAQLAASP